MRHLAKRAFPVFILGLFAAGAAVAGGNSGGNGMYWFSSTTSHMLNRSSVALATGHVNRGIHFAHAALQEKLSSRDELIANHNLCIGYAVSGDNMQASPYCDRAFELAQGPGIVTVIRGSFRLQESAADDNHGTTLTPLQILVSNLQSHALDTRLSLRVQ